ncbi:iron ABC transporter permease [Microvenator marinus]|uniref:Iron ABC transporter permease n=1 Tax=Microvenator marinus TaxID=2600177 RepID=A0A5B8XTF6_9DELT|nr:iron ABC transporter permease [Microvenator marinus]QED28960.1 iron ABC transporter permease [Microvenator marinus]
MKSHHDKHPFLHLMGGMVALAMLLPLGWLALYALELWDTAASSVLSDSSTLQALWNGLSLALAVAATCVVIAVPLAWLTHATDMPFRKFFRVALNLPLAVPSYVSGFVVVAAAGPRGWIQEVVEPLGIQMPEVYGFNGAYLALLFTFPYVLIPLQAALGRMDSRVWEAARSLGSSPVRAFFTVVLPNLRGAIGAGALMVALYVMSDFGAVSLLRFKSLSYVIYVRYQSLFDKDEAVFLALILAMVAICFVLVYRVIRGSQAGSSKGVVQRWSTVELGVWRWPAFAFSCLVTAVGVGLPVLTVGIWLVRGLKLGNEIGGLATYAWSTLWIGLVAAVITVLIALGPALLERHGNPHASRVVHLSSHVGYALPGIVVALSLVFFSIRFAGPFYQTAPMLIFAYVVLFLPLALGAVEDGLRGQNPRFYDAARSLGSSPLRAWTRVIIPGLKGAVVAGFLIVFMSVIKELPATLLLSPLDFGSLATRIWSLTEEAFFTAAAPPVLLLLLMASLALIPRTDSGVAR